MSHIIISIFPHFFSNNFLSNKLSIFVTTKNIAQSTQDAYKKNTKNYIFETQKKHTKDRRKQ